LTLIDSSVHSRLGPISVAERLSDGRERLVDTRDPLRVARRAEVRRDVNLLDPLAADQAVLALCFLSHCSTGFSTAPAVSSRSPARMAVSSACQNFSGRLIRMRSIRSRRFSAAPNLLS